MTLSINKEKYLKNGYVVAKGLFEPRDILAVMTDINTVFSCQLKLLKESHEPYINTSSLLNNMKRLLVADQPRYLAAARHSAKLLTVQKLSVSKNISTLCDEFELHSPSVPTAPVLHISSEQLKIKNGYFGVREHQDWSSIQGGLKSIVVWIPFMNITNNNFPLELIPNSHRQGLMSGEADNNSYVIKDSLYQNSDFIRPTLDVGDAVIMSVFTLHRTALENCKGFRLACSMRFEDSCEDTFIDRAYPCAYQRTISREFITPNFPREEQVAKVFKG